MSRDRYPGAQPFTEAQSSIFFGRQKATAELYQLIRQESLVVLYAKSGLGKSSLINAGIIPLARKEKVFRPVPIRFLAFTGKEKTPVETTRERVKMGANAKPSFLSQLIEEDNSLWRILKEQQLSKDKKEGLLLIFDQFEELFTYPAEAQLHFRRQLAEALYSPVPQRYWDILDLYGPEKTPLKAEQLAALQESPEIRILVSIRQDRMHLLGNLSDYLPTISKHWYELKALNKTSAQLAIVAPAKATGDFNCPPFEYDAKALETMLDFLSGNGRESIESTQLQIVCNAIEQRVAKRGIETVDKEVIGSLSEIIENYYSEKIATIDDSEQQLAARCLIEEGLIFEEEERRLSLYEGQILQSYDILPETLRALVDSHLLRAEPSLRGGYTYELSHDTLVAPILKAKAERLEADRLVQEARERERQARILAEERRKRIRSHWVAIGTSLLALIASAMASWALYQQNETQKALNAYEEARRQRLSLEVEALFESAKIYQDAGYPQDALYILDSIASIDTSTHIQERIVSLKKNWQQ